MLETLPCHAVESAKSQLKGGYVDLGRGVFRVFGVVKISFLVAFSLAAYNLDRARNFKARLAEKSNSAKGARKRRLGTWQALMGERAEPLVAFATGPPANSYRRCFSSWPPRGPALARHRSGMSLELVDPSVLKAPG